MALPAHFPADLLIMYLPRILLPGLTGWCLSTKYLLLSLNLARRPQLIFQLPKEASGTRHGRAQIFRRMSWLPSVAVTSAYKLSG